MEEHRGPDWFEAVVPLLLLVFPGALVLQVLQGLGAVPSGPTGGDGWTELRMGLQGLNCVLVLAWMMVRRRDLRSGNPALLRTVGLYAGLLIIWVPVMIGYLRLLDLITPTEPQSHLEYFVDVDFTRPGLWVGFAVAVFLGPLAEEVVFRGYLYGALKRSLGVTRALLLSSALFGLIHGLDYALPLAFLGLFFGWLRERSGGLVAPIVAHVLHNALTVAVTIMFPSLLEWAYQQ